MTPLLHVECNKVVKEVCDKLKFVLERYVKTEDGQFTFPDGDTWPCGKAKEAL